MDLIHGDPHPLFFGVSEAARCDQRKRDRTDAGPGCQGKALSVAGPEELLLSLISAQEQGTYRMDNIFRRQTESRSEKYFAFPDWTDLRLAV